MLRYASFIQIINGKYVNENPQPAESGARYSGGGVGMTRMYILIIIILCFVPCISLFLAIYDSMRLMRCVKCQKVMRRINCDTYVIYPELQYYCCPYCGGNVTKLLNSDCDDFCICGK